MNKIMLVFLAIGGSLVARDLKTNDGQLYKDINVVEKQATGLKIVHSKGRSFIKYSELSPALQKEFGYSGQPTVIDQKHKGKLERKRKEEQQAKNKAVEIKKDILAKGELLYFVKKQLYNLNGTASIFNLPTIGSVCPGNNQFMIYRNRIYRVKGNVVTVSHKITDLYDQVANLKKENASYDTQIEMIEKRVSLNLNRISRVMSNTGSSALSGGSDENGTVFVNDLSSTQKRFIRDLERDNRKFERETRKFESQMSENNDRIEKLMAEAEQLEGKTKAFKLTQNKFSSKRSGKDVVVNGSVAQPSILKLKLLKLKKLFNEKFISKEVYDLKSKELLDELL